MLYFSRVRHIVISGFLSLAMLVGKATSAPGPAMGREPPSSLSPPGRSNLAWLTAQNRFPSIRASAEPKPADGGAGQYESRRIPVKDSRDNPVELRNYFNATNVALQRLAAFIRTNPVNLAAFEPGKFVCTEFGLALHNAAEAAGLRCGLVTVAFEQGEGHVLNAFETTDKGLVYVDCTGMMGGTLPRSEFDTFGYLQAGKKYGRLPLEVGYPEPVKYERYEQIERLWEQAEREEAAWRQARQRLTVQDRALRLEEQELRRQLAGGDSPALLQTAENLAKRRAELDRQNADLRRQREKLNGLFRQLRGRIFHSNTSPVRSFKVWW